MIELNNTFLVDYKKIKWVKLYLETDFPEIWITFQDDTSVSEIYDSLEEAQKDYKKLKTKLLT